MSVVHGKIPLRRAIVVIALGLAALGACSSAPAATSRQAAIATRQANFKSMGSAMKAIFDQLKVDAPDRAVLTTNARSLATIAPRQAALFPRGSGPEAGMKTGALPAIWADRTTFDADFRALVTETNKLAAMTGTADKEAMQAQVKAVGGTCAACHRQFRAKD